MKTTLLIAGLAISLSSLAPAQNVRISQDGRPENMARIPPKAGINAQDRKFMNFACHSNAFEIMSSELALQRAQSEWARNFARDMIREHTMAQNELKMLAREKGVQLDQTLPKKMQAELDRLSRLSGAEFDRAYRDIQLKAHQETALMMERQIKNGRDSMIRNYAVKSLPAVKKHREMAMQRTTMMGHTTRMEPPK